MGRMHFACGMDMNLNNDRYIHVLVPETCGFFIRQKEFLKVIKLRILKIDYPDYLDGLS